MRPRVLVPLLLAAAAGPARAQHVASSPPPARVFGHDSTAAGVFTAAGLACDAPPPPRR